MPGSPVNLICVQTTEFYPLDGKLESAKILEVVGIEQQNSATLWQNRSTPRNRTVESPLQLPDYETGRLVEYFERFFAGPTRLGDRRNCLGFAAFIQGWSNEGYTWCENSELIATPVPSEESKAGKPYGFYGKAPLGKYGLQHAVIGTGIDNDCLSVHGVNGLLVRKPCSFTQYEIDANGYFGIKPLSKACLLQQHIKD